MRKLSRCKYPHAMEKEMHGMQPLPSILLKTTMYAAHAFRSLIHS